MNNNGDKKLKLQWLDWNRLQALDPVLQSRGQAALNQYTSRAIGMYDGEGLVGFVVLQLYPFLGPLWVDPTYRGQGVPDKLADEIIGWLEKMDTRGYLAIADSPFTVKLCERVGMKRVESPVFINVKKENGEV